MRIEADFMHRIAAAAAAQTLPRFRQAGLVSANKLAGGFDPVTEADRDAEQAIRALIREAFPDHGIIGEEFGRENETARYQWVIDPIDGTRSFISGIPLWGTLVGLTDDGDAVAGMMSQPFTGELFWADETSSQYSGPGGDRQLKTRPTKTLAEAMMCTTTPRMFKDHRSEVYDQLERSVKLARYGTDCYAYVMLASGSIDLVVETSLQTYDIMALVPIIERAGGVITTWDGGPAEAAGDIVAAATPELHEAAMKILNG